MIQEQILKKGFRESSLTSCHPVTMPTYTYRRADGTTFDIEQRITEEALDTCPTTGQAVRRVITAGAGLVFKGSGFYLTDYARRSAGPAPGSDATPAAESGSPQENGKAKPAAAPAPSSASDDSAS